tara:strand:- start:107 stop:259 length:153 start_codon:yes stop_codon:yes gene_type:complete
MAIKILRIDTGSIESLRKGEKAKWKLERQGYNLIDTKIDGITKVVMIYQK